MRAIEVLLSYLLIVECGHKLKLDYWDNLIKEAFDQVEKYKIRQDNKDLIGNLDPEEKEIEYGQFDFIIVGAGSSGSVVAPRLSETERFQVLLLEAGDWDDDLTSMVYISGLLQYSERDWGYFTTSQKNGCYGWKDQKCAYPRGKIVGGSGSINFLVHTRGNAADYDNWESLGNPGWSFKDVLPYFRKLENFQSNSINLYHRGFAGPVNVAYKVPLDNLTDITNAYSEIGAKFLVDYNEKRQMGISRMQRNTKYGERVSGSTAYVRPSSTRHNFNVTVRAFVTKVLIDKVTKTAYGVHFIKNGQLYKATARKEVIVSAGAVNTPQLLMLSGIGPEDELKKHGIPVIANLPVGKHLNDHNWIPVSYKTNLTVNIYTFRESIEQFLDGKGVLTTFRDEMSISFFNTRNKTSSVPNIEISFVQPSVVPKAVPLSTNYTESVQEFMNSIDPSRYFSFYIFLLHPKSFGTLKLKSSSPIDFPLIDLGIFSDPDDMQVLYEGIEIVNRIAKTKALEKYDFELMNYKFCNQHEGNSREYWFCVLKSLASTVYHTSSTAKMGPKNDPLAVVDNELRVYGINGLRVADCSIMPTTISGHNNIPAFMIGEKAADLIKKIHKN